MKKFTIRGTGQEIKIDDKDFITFGGEGEIFGKGNTAYKIYFDSSKMLPMQKYNELSNLKPNPYIFCSTRNHIKYKKCSSWIYNATFKRYSRISIFISTYFQTKK